ncbi:uncharacterized protein XM38_042610 [Halomicronema hongdechloris C2206]|uniref:Novel STAND NTPase 1 domain-containing protein n=1 Tax=Halomicronema hongdechloris C2206 TaxID=1641165 RepID=A0A1Z3HT41_9CYAN|nr:ATP-binding protein [Halomicronema hongdechloris]ASC73297.1 uncharacterized protein XM38_042610 [Halomicronema hongdechloris C2206]
MTSPYPTAKVLEHNRQGLIELQRALQLRSHRFSLILARCNYSRLRQMLITAVQQAVQVEADPLTIAVVDLAQLDQSLTLRQAMQVAIDDIPPPLTVMVTGLELVRDLEEVLRAANLGRDDFPKAFPCPLVLWCNDRILHLLNHHAPDFRSFATAPISFDYPTDELIQSLHRGANQLFTTMLSLGDDSSLPGQAPLYRQGSLLRTELEFALTDIAHQSGPLSAELQASLDFLKGRDAFSRGELDVARLYFTRSLEYWQQQTSQRSPVASSEGTTHSILEPAAPTPSDKQAVLLFYMGAWWRQYAIRHRQTYRQSCEQARHYFSACLECLRQEQRLDLVGKFLHALAEVLQKLAYWAELEALAQEGQQLHRDDPVRLARNYGYLAEVALARGNASEAEAAAIQALEILKIAEAVQATGAEAPDGWDVATRFQRSWYFYLLGRVQIVLGQPDQAIEQLLQARQHGNPEVDLVLYRSILETLRQQYFQRRAYRRAFHIKLEQRQLETRFRLRAFIGAGQIQPYESSRLASLNGSTQALLATEIEASGRQQDVIALVQRLEQARYQLIVLHGPSGVGKSSILYAGLVPALRRSFPDGRTTLPVLVTAYRNWPDAIYQAVIVARQRQPLGLYGGAMPTAACVDRHGLLDQLRSLVNQQFQQVVLIFDQVEEFFVEATTLDQRREFYQFLCDCLNTPFLKVVMALREDYFLYLLEWERLCDLDIINNDILSRDVRYYLGNFSPRAAEDLLRRLTTRANFYLDEPLIERLVQDLTDAEGGVRPIELQVVGAQLQRQGIVSLWAYDALGPSPKETLVQQFLGSVVQDCGPEQEPLARWILYLLTEEAEESDGRLQRPLKSREELEEELALLRLPFRRPALDLVLEILVKSGLVFEIPEWQGDRYQLVHDYLVGFIRQQPGIDIDAVLEHVTLDNPAMGHLARMTALEHQIRRLRLMAVVAWGAVLVACLGAITAMLP